jgi:hypothetical protein
MKRIVMGIAVIPAALIAILGTPAGAASPCGERVLLDWSDNGRIDKLYALPCYDEAIAEMPADLRDYTDAPEVITRALAAAVRGGGDAGGSSSAGVAPEIDTSRASSAPIALLGLGAIALLTFGLGGFGFVVRRVRARHEHTTTA